VEKNPSDIKANISVADESCLPQAHCKKGGDLLARLQKNTMDPYEVQENFRSPKHQYPQKKSAMLFTSITVWSSPIK